MDSIQTSLEKMGSNFLVAGMIPSLAFVTSIYFVFEPILPRALLQKLTVDLNPLIEFGLLILLGTVILGFTLTSLNTFIIKVFEGYIIIQRIAFLRKFEVQRYRIQKRRIESIGKRIQSLKDRKKFESKLGRLLSAKEKRLVYEHQVSFPPDEGEVMPTRFGNILKAAEAYPMARYKIDAVPLWPRLIHVIPSKYNEKIEITHNQLSFLLNCAVLSLLFAFCSACGALYQFLLSFLLNSGKQELLYFVPIDRSFDVYQQRMLLYVIGSGVALIFAIVFNRAALLSVSEFGETIRSSYDLFRFDLLKQLHIPLPKNSKRELELWMRITNFVNIGYALEGRAEVPVIDFDHASYGQVTNSETHSPPDSHTQQ